MTFGNIIDSDAKTGTRCIVLATGAPVWTTSLPAGAYTLTFFEKGGNAGVLLGGGATLLNSQTVASGSDGWVLQVKQINIMGTGNSISLTGSNIKIDEVRIYPKDAMMSTTSYSARGLPASVTDAQMTTMYFEYDAWGRVTLVRDKNRNILEHYEYNLADN